MMSFYKVNFNQPNEWVGLDNFTRAFFRRRTARGGGKHPAVRRGNDVCRGYPAFFLAMLLEGPARHLRFIRTAIFYLRSPVRQSSPKCGVFYSTQRPTAWLTTS